MVQSIKERTKWNKMGRQKRRALKSDKKVVSRRFQNKKMVVMPDKRILE